MSDLPTLYTYYTSGGINAGLLDNQTYFTLNGKNITLYSGALHYFRVPSDYWIDRLRKMRAVGLNAVETYVPWNLHEPVPGVYDFGQGGTDFQSFLDIEKFLKIAQEEDLLVILRPGPYICAEWDFGGMPSWLLCKKDIYVRTSDSNFIAYVDKYFTQLLKILSKLQFTRGGPIIAFQIENEYGNVKKINEPIDYKYLEVLHDMLRSKGIVELLFTSDTPSNGKWGSLDSTLYTANFQDDAEKELKLLQSYQPSKPLMVMEYWTGWFDHWTEKHHTRSCDDFAAIYEKILQFPASVNMYMFHGGTNWGFLNGANISDNSIDNRGYQPDVSSYDYDAPLSEAGDYTDKYYLVQKLIRKYNYVQTRLPELPKLVDRIIYDTVEVTDELNIMDLINNAEHVVLSANVVSMECLPINNSAGQSFGYVVYRKKGMCIPVNSVLKIEGRVCDTVIVLINGKIKSKILHHPSDLNDFGYWRVKDATLNLGSREYLNATLDLIVENWGRSNYGKLDQFDQRKGLWQGNVLLNSNVILNWEIIPLEFKQKWTTNLRGWHKPKFEQGPAVYRGKLFVNEKRDTYMDMRGWKKGIIIINGFVLSRYLRIGPQQTAYLPAPLLKHGENEIVIFEHFVPDTLIKFTKNPIYESLE